MKRILVGVDRSENAASALRWAARIAGPWDAYVVAMWAWSPDQAELPPEEWERDHRAARAFVDARLRDIADVDPGRAVKSWMVPRSRCCWNGHGSKMRR